MAQLNKRDWRDVWRFLEEFPQEIQFEGTLTDEQEDKLSEFQDRLEAFFDACVGLGLAFDALVCTPTGYQEVQ